MIDHPLAQVQGKDAESILDESGLVGQPKKQLVKRILATELSHRLEAEVEQGKAGHCRGSSPKTVTTSTASMSVRE
ncbi:hypothetical protein WL42_07280 [Burkholderia ubonensis]|nr:hypothetical protein [Burkholderia ubonensis]KWB82939.1 hypothetical protein WL42_07280 [Burkholderia ubonensis]